MTEIQPRYAISYQRISSTQQRDGTGLERQNKATEQWCEDNGFIVVVKKCPSAGAPPAPDASPPPLPTVQDVPSKR